jgi:serine/threonine-protein kinase
MQLPAQFGKYLLEEYLGGGMSRVYRARNPLINQTVVVKILTDEASADPNAKARFLEEARTVASVSHDNIIRMYDYGEDAQGHPFMVMEYLEGADLASLIKSGRTGQLRDKLRIAAQIAAALEHIHSQDPPIVHRDIKPHNIHVNPDGKIKLMDFGIAKARDLALTGTGLTLGTPFYMAPEQVLGRGVTHLVDVYAFGILLFELLTGTRPLGGDSVEQIFYQILHGTLNLEPLKQAGVPPALSDLIAGCTAKEPAQRIQDFRLVRQGLQQILGQEEQAGRGPAPLPPPPPSGKIWKMALAALALVVALVAAYFVFRPSVQVQLEELVDTPTGKMVLVRAGPFLAGKDRRTVNQPGFYIDQREVTNAAYARFCGDRQRPLPERFPQDRPNYPVVNITFVDAQEFARWAQKRLPRLLEWEKAARGADGRLYPWGNQADPTRANVNRGGNPELMPVSAYPEGESPWHALNMVGNAWEFVDQFQTPSEGALSAFKTLLDPPPTATEPWYTIRGGSYRQPLFDSVLSDWAAVPARYRNDDIGFRCAKDVK